MGEPCKALSPLPRVFGEPKRPSSPPLASAPCSHPLATLRTRPLRVGTARHEPPPPVRRFSSSSMSASFLSWAHLRFALAPRLGHGTPYALSYGQTALNLPNPSICRAAWVDTPPPLSTETKCGARPFPTVRPASHIGHLPIVGLFQLARKIGLPHSGLTSLPSFASWPEPRPIGR